MFIDILQNKKKLIAIIAALALIVTSLAIAVTSCEKDDLNTKEEIISLYEGDEALTAMAEKAQGVNLYEDYKTVSYETVKLMGDSIEYAGDGAEVRGADLIIKTPGVYVLSGNLDDGAIVVESKDEENVHIVLENANITCKDGAPIYIKECGKNVFLSVPEGTESTLTDGEAYTYEYVVEKADEESGEVDIQPDGAVFAKSDIVINGAGTLTVNASANHGIVGKDDVEIAEINLVVKAKDNGIVGKDSVAVRSGEITVNAGGDGIKSTNDEEAEKGYICIADGSFVIHSEEDGMQAESVLLILDGEYNITTGGGYEKRLALEQAVIDAENSMMGGGFGGGQRPEGNEPPDGFNPPEGMQRPEEMTQEEREAFEKEMRDNAPAKGEAQKADPEKQKVLEEAEATLEADDTSRKGLKANSKVLIQDGVFYINAADDGMKADEHLAIAAGDIKIHSGGDGLQSENKLDVYGGNIEVEVSVEGLEGKEIVIHGGEIVLTSIDDGLNVSGDKLETDTDNSFTLNIKGGLLVIDAEGDGIDINGSGYMSGGHVIVNGPTLGMNAALDYDDVFEVTGGTFVAVGSMGMAQTPSGETTVCTISANVGSQKAGTEIALVNSDGEVIYSVTPEKDFAHIVIACEDMIKGEAYKIMSGEKELASFTTEEIITNLGGGFGDRQRPVMPTQQPVQNN